MTTSVNVSGSIFPSDGNSTETLTNATYNLTAWLLVMSPATVSSSDQESMRNLFGLRAYPGYHGTFVALLFLVILTSIQFLSTMHDFMFLLYLDRFDTTKDPPVSSASAGPATLARKNASALRRRFRRSVFFFDAPTPGNPKESYEFLAQGESYYMLLQREQNKRMSRLSIPVQSGKEGQGSSRSPAARDGYSRHSALMMRGQSKIIGIDLREDSESDEDQECNDADLDARRRAWWQQRQLRNANRGSRLTIGRSREGSGFSFFPSAYGFRKSTFENVDKIPTIVVQNAESSPADIVPPIHVTAGPGVSAIPYDIGVSEDNENLHPKVVEALLKAERESVFNKTRSKVYSNSFTDDAIPAMPIVLPVTASYQQRVSKEARRKTIIWDPIPARNVEPEKEKDIFRRSRTKSYYVEWAFSRVSMWGGPAALFGFDLTQPLPNSEGFDTAKPSGAHADVQPLPRDDEVTLEIRPSLALSEASLSSANFEITKKRRSRQTRLKGARAQDVEASITQNDDYTATHIRGSHPLSGSETLPLTACTNPDSNNIHRSELVVLVNSGELSESPDDRLTQYSANPENFYKARPPSPISARFPTPPRRDLKNAEFFASKPGAPLPTWPLTSSLPRRLSVDPAQNFNIISSSEVDQLAQTPVISSVRYFTPTRKDLNKNFFSPSQPDASIHTTSSLPRPLSGIARIDMLRSASMKSLEVWKSAERTIESAKAVRSRTLHRYTKASSVRSTEEETIDGTIGGGALGSRGQIMAHASLDRRHGFSDRLLYEMGDGQDGKGQSQSLENFLVAGTNSIVFDDRSRYLPVVPPRPAEAVSLQRNKT